MSGNVASQIPKWVHIQYYMTFDLNKLTVATKNKYQRWFSKFKSGNFDFNDSYRSILDNDMLRVKVEVNPCQTMELSNTLNQPWSSICVKKTHPLLAGPLNLISEAKYRIFF